MRLSRTNYTMSVESLYESTATLSISLPFSPAGVGPIFVPIFLAVLAFVGLAVVGPNRCCNTMRRVGVGGFVHLVFPPVCARALLLVRPVHALLGIIPPVRVRVLLRLVLLLAHVCASA